MVDGVQTHQHVDLKRLQTYPLEVAPVAQFGIGKGLRRVPDLEEQWPEVGQFLRDRWGLKFFGGIASYPSDLLQMLPD